MPERRALRACAAALCLLLAGGLGGCGSGEDEETPGAAADAAAPSPGAPAAREAAPVAKAEPEAAPEAPLGAEERARAEAALDFHNTALNALETGYYALPEALYANAGFYLKTWQLPRGGAPKGNRQAARARLRPQAGLFSEEEAAKLTAALDDMDKALDSLLANYKALEAYVADRRIRDDGARGKALARKISGDHAVFMAARKSWLEIVEARAAAAEAALLREHPLRRQIGEAGAIFNAYARAAELLGAEEKEAGPAGPGKSATARGAGEQATAKGALDAASRATLAHIHAELENRIAEAGRPPFAAAPQLERLYRAFLKEARAYAAALGRGLDEGFFPPQRRELNLAAVRSRAAYNAFVREANGLRAR